MAEANLLLDALIDEAGMSYAGLASRLNRGRTTRYDHASVRRWIRDNAIPRGGTPELICRVLGGAVGRSLALVDIGMDRARHGDLSDIPLRTAIDQAAALWRGDHVQSDAVEDTRMLVGNAAVAPAFAWENPPDDIDVSHRGPRVVGRCDVVRVRSARDRYEQMYRRVGGIPVRPRIVAYLNNQAGPLIRGGYDDRTGRALLRATGGLIALAGISAYDADRQALAQRYLLHALLMAKASGHRGSADTAWRSWRTRRCTEATTGVSCSTPRRHCAAPTGTCPQRSPSICTRFRPRRTRGSAIPAAVTGT